MEWKDLFKGKDDYGWKYEISNEGYVRRKDNGELIPHSTKNGTTYSHIWDDVEKRTVRINIGKSLLDSGFANIGEYKKTYKNKLISPYTTNVFLTKEERDYIKDKVNKLIEQIIIDKNL